MTIPTQMSLHGFIATAPQINFTGNGAARFYARIGVEHFRKETDGSFTKLDPTFHDLVAYAKTAERASSRAGSGTTSRARSTTSTGRRRDSRTRRPRTWPGPSRSSSAVTCRVSAELILDSDGRNPSACL
jgi:hypothetical protein